jgi:hypothetical protein
MISRINISRFANTVNSTSHFPVTAGSADRSCPDELLDTFMKQ